MAKTRLREKEQTLALEDGEVLFREGETSREMYVIQEGAVEVRKRVADADVVISTLERGEFFGEMSLILDLPRSATVTAKGPTRLLVLHSGSFLLRIRRDPTFAYELINSLCARFRRTDMALAELIRKTGLKQEEVDKLFVAREYKSKPAGGG